MRGEGTNNRVYIALFTCAVIRAVHIEIVEDLSESEFISAFIRFSSRRSLPSVILSDNASYFCAASKTLKQICESSYVQNYLSERRLQWKFITPRAASQGGMWERLVGLLKVTMRKVLGNSYLHLRELRTLVTQIEAKLNDRPITYISDDDSLQPLTPSDLMFGFRLQELPCEIDVEEILDPSFASHDRLNKRYKYCTVILAHFWRRWRGEYLLSLRERFDSVSSVPGKIPVVGDVVLIHEDCSRLGWRLGKIVSLYNGRDGYCRSATVKTQNSTYDRPINKLYPLEIRSIDFSSDTGNATEPFVKNNLPKRKAAIEALAKITSKGF